MSQKGISFRLNSHITSIAIVIILTVVYMNYHFSNKILIGKIEEGAINQSNFIISSVLRVTVGAEEITRNVSNQALYYHQHNDLDLFLNQVLASNPSLESIHVEVFDRPNKLRKYSANLNGQLICNPDSLAAEKYLYDLKNISTAANSGAWSEPFFCKYDSTHLLASYRVPILSNDGKKVAGVVSCEVSLKKLSQMLSKIKIKESGYSFIIDQAGNFITHPNNEWILKRNLFEKPSRLFEGDVEKITKKIQGGGSGANHGISEFLNFQKSWFYYSPLGKSGWNIIIVVPEKELFREIDVIFQKILMVSGIGILLLFFLNMIIFRKMLDPLAQISRAIQRFSSAKGSESNTKNEIYMLAESLESWQAQYGTFIKEKAQSANEKLKIEKDLKSAREIQLNILPSGKPTFTDHPEIDLSAVFKPAETIGGDLYDYFFIDSDHLLVAIGDVSGKGISASLFMAIASTLIKTNAKLIPANEIITLVNNELSGKNSNQFFITIFIGILNVKTGELDYCNAAHNHPYLLHPDGKIENLAESHGLPLGIYKNTSYKHSSIEMKKGDSLLLYTDGVINSQDLNKQHFGTVKLETILENMQNSPADEIVDRLVKSINIYEGSSGQADDITILAIKYLPEQKNQV